MIHEGKVYSGSPGVWLEVDWVHRIRATRWAYDVGRQVVARMAEAVAQMGISFDEVRESVDRLRERMQDAEVVEQAVEEYEKAETSVWEDAVSELPSLSANEIAAGSITTQYMAVRRMETESRGED